MRALTVLPMPMSKLHKLVINAASGVTQKGASNDAPFFVLIAAMVDGHLKEAIGAGTIRIGSEYEQYKRR